VNLCVPDFTVSSYNNSVPVIVAYDSVNGASYKETSNEFLFHKW
jgi:hypothetical protein